MRSAAGISSEQKRLARIGDILARGMVALARNEERSTRQNLMPPAAELRVDSELSALLVFALQVGEVSIGSAIERLGLSRTTAHRRLSNLVERGLLERRGEGRASRYLPVANHSKTKKSTAVIRQLET